PDRVDYGHVANWQDQSQPTPLDGTEGRVATMTKSRNDRALGVKAGSVVQMLGWDDDCDQKLRDAVAESSGQALVDDDYDDVVDTVLLWWRDDDGDLIDGLLDAITMLADRGSVWLLTPKAGRDGHVEPEDVAEAGPTAGLRITANISAAADWQGTRYAQRS
ncbi:MAG: DUF3052 family protein, partial [Chloroflexota bacterium]|nr:DUF3052 family protein [Chloroflexota bacterium]